MTFATVENAQSHYQSKRLDEWFRSNAPNHRFPGDADYISRLNSIHDYLKRDVWPGAVAAALAASKTADGSSLFLNDHGEAHIMCVIRRMTDLLHRSQLQISPYESYVLLAATYLHDVGIVYGREQHENKCHKILATLGSRAGEDVIEKLVILQIAQAHGGLNLTGNKDTIKELETKTRILGEHVRVQVLAALLRLSDELADERERANRFMLDHQGKLLAGSEAYHAYSYALQSVMVEPPDIYLDFELLKKFADRELAKEQGSIYLLEEIYRRTLKMQQETVYCMRFLRPHINIDRVRVKIKVFDNYDSNTFLRPKMELGYTLEELTAYPDYSGKTIQDLLPDDNLPTGIALRDQLWPTVQ